MCRNEIQLCKSFHTHKHMNKSNTQKTGKSGYEIRLDVLNRALDMADGKYHQFEAVTDCVAFELYWAEFDHEDIERETVGHA